jgi:hypothetical protein
VIEFLVAEKESVRNIHKHLCNVYGNVVVNRSTAGRRVKSSNAPGTGKAELNDLPQAILPQLLAPKFCSVLRPLFARTDASKQQLALSLSISKGRVDQIMRSLISEGVHYMVSSEPQS